MTRSDVWTAWRVFVRAIFLALPLRLRQRIVRVVTPNYTLGSVVILRDQHERLLLLRQPPGRAWSLPGGLANRGESSAAAASRELAEETGIALPPEALTPATPSALVNPRSQQVDCVFMSTVDSNEFRIVVDPVEVIEGRWFTAEELPRLTRPTAALLRNYRVFPRH
jgi:8-oxo-dGTP pyrophosphatase MutT (NUDIX family)